MIRATVWNEFFHETHVPEVIAIYPDGIHGAVAAALSEAGMETRCAWLEQPEHGLTQEVLDNTDVLFWWGHMRHELVSDEVTERVALRVQNGMGLVTLHSGHASKPFKRLMGTRTGGLRWRESEDKQLMWCVSPGHPIAQGLGEYITIPMDETYGEFFEIPTPDDLVYISWFSGGEVFRSVCSWNRGAGRVVYIQCGHETYPIYYQPEIKRLLVNAAKWATPGEAPLILGEGRHAKIPPAKE